MKKTKGSVRWAKETKQKHLGIHLIAEFWGGRKIEDPIFLGKILEVAARKARNTPLKFTFHKFNPHGLTGILLLSESHIAFHSWPEFNYIALDIFSCGKKVQPELAIDYLRKKIKPKIVEIRKVKRGILKRKNCLV